MKSDKKSGILLIGGGGHCKSVIDVIEQEGIYEIAGIIDNDIDAGERLLAINGNYGYKVLGGDDDLPRLRELYEYAFITVGHIRSPEIRIKLFDLVKSLNFNVPVICSPRAYISRYAVIEEGTVVMHDALINANARIGRNCIINTKALVEHDAVVEDFCHISTAAVVNGAATVRQKTFFGSNATSRESVVTKESDFIKAGDLLK